jgi:signal transduction histidine kinase
MGSAGIIDNVRKIQAINEEKALLHPEDINDMIIECINGAHKPEGKKVTINYTPRKGLMINGTALMKEVFCNLIYNAIKHSGNEVVIDVSVDTVDRSGKKFYDVYIADNGPGISDDIKSRLFNRFQRGKTKAHGKGLGLFIARSLVENIGGDVRVEDRVQGDYSKGAKFVVSLPVCEGCK